MEPETWNSLVNYFRSCAFIDCGNIDSFE